MKVASGKRRTTFRLQPKSTLHPVHLLTVPLGGWFKGTPPPFLGSRYFDTHVNMAGGWGCGMALAQMAGRFADHRAHATLQSAWCNLLVLDRNCIAIAPAVLLVKGFLYTAPLKRLCAK